MTGCSHFEQGTGSRGGNSSDSQCFALHLPQVAMRRDFLSWLAKSDTARRYQKFSFPQATKWKNSHGNEPENAPENPKSLSRGQLWLRSLELFDYPVQIFELFLAGGRLETKID
jgi:hypothetical protein